jgi:hypothetical protein
MTEKLSINLTEGDVTVRQKESDDPRIEPVISYFSQCPICGQTIDLTRIKGACCECDIEWRVEVKIRGTRAVDDDDKFQMPIPWKAAAAETKVVDNSPSGHDADQLQKEPEYQSGTVSELPENPVLKPETPQNEVSE